MVTKANNASTTQSRFESPRIVSPPHPGRQPLLSSVLHQPGRGHCAKEAVLNLIGKLNRRFSSRQTVAAISLVSGVTEMEVINEQ